MLHQHTSFFGQTEKMLAWALHAAGQTDRQIADANRTSVNNIMAWRNEEGLPENLSPEARARAEEDQYSPPVRRDTPSRAQLVAARAASNPRAAAPRLTTPAEAQAAFVAPVQPEGDNALEIGLHMDAKVFVDLEELLTTRLLIQGNSGSGKTHLLRRLLEECAGIVQQVIIDPEGDFASFGDAFGHTILDANTLTTARLATIAGKVRQHRGSVVLTLEGMEIEPQMQALTAFLNALFEEGPQHWHPAIVAVDEAHLFAPAGDNGEDRETRKQSQQAMANLMCRGRKRGLAGIIATQRLSKLHKNVAAEASNYLLGRTFLDIDIQRAAELLGLRGSDAEQVRSLVRGEFLGLGPAIARRMLKVKVGSVMTQGKAGPPKGITPLPSIGAAEMQSLMLADDDAELETITGPVLRVVK
ncbi:DUF87 domain-containing protein [Sphingomonas sp. DG1-23]|uniref:helicase HerA domain-containing protein n=1 Tax=Sphingomonas sp. DG1-23 TaxID=3068316 RepID=UPI00273F89C1|nr:DUF87 domain-containing protein [Sphingomonas sp. DG1-23]MDP5279929.1 DUF87 domain-containing protein [Sphingomonas sp. DG1-23]